MQKRVFITGATSGIGLAAAQELCRRGASVMGIGSSPASCQKAYNIIKQNYPDADITFYDCDLSSTEAVRELAGKVPLWLDGQALDVFVHNAGIFTRWCQNSADGIEMQFAVNYLSGFMLSLLLLPYLKISKDARIITTTSGSHKYARLNLNDILLRMHYNCLWAYKCTKMENVLYSYEWNRRIGIPLNIRAYAADPGLVNTDMGLKHTSGIIAWFWNNRKHKGVSPDEGSQTLVHLACEDLRSTKDAVYFKDSGPCKHDKYAAREDIAKKLWAFSEKICGLNTEAMNHDHRRENY